MVYFWNVRQLSDDLRNGRVSEREKMKYLLANSLVWALFYEMTPSAPPEKSDFDVVLSLTYLATVVWGICVCYGANRQGDDRDFIARFTCLSWPLGLRLATLYMAVYFAYMIAGYARYGERFDVAMGTTTRFDVSLWALFSVHFYWRIRYWLLRASGAIDEFGYHVKP